MDIRISKVLIKIAKVCEKNGMEVEALFLNSVAIFFCLGYQGLNSALKLFGNEMTRLADSQYRLIKLLNRLETDLQREKNAKNN